MADLSEREQIVVRMWNANHSQREIAEAMGVSIGVVSGIATRLKRRHVIKPKTQEQVSEACSRATTDNWKARPARELVAPSKKKRPEPDRAPSLGSATPDERRTGVTIMKLTSDRCHWVLPRKGKSGLPMYCGDEVYHRGFCAFHASQCFIVPNDWRPGSRKYRRLKLLLSLVGR